MNEQVRDRFTFFASYYEALQDLNDEDRLATYDAICQYALTGKMPKLSGVPSTILKLISPVLETGKARSKAGQNGGKISRKNKQTVSKPEANGKQNISKPEANGKQTVSYYMEQEQEQDMDQDVCVEHNAHAHTREDATHDTHDTHDTQHTPTDPTVDKTTPDPPTDPVVNDTAPDSLIDPGEVSPGTVPTVQQIRDRLRELNRETNVSAFIEYNRRLNWRRPWPDALDAWLEHDTGPKQARAKPRTHSRFDYERGDDLDAIQKQLVAAQRAATLPGG